jgi:hypothetical protein
VVFVLPYEKLINERKFFEKRMMGRKFEHNMEEKQEAEKLYNVELYKLKT